MTLVDCDHIGWKSWKLNARTLSPTYALRSRKAIHLLPGEHGEILGRLEVGWEKVACWSTEAAIYLKQTFKDRRKVTMGAIGTHQRSFEWYHPRSRTASSSPRLGFATPMLKFNRYYLRNGQSYGLQILQVHS